MWSPHPPLCLSLPQPRAYPTTPLPCCCLITFADFLRFAAGFELSNTVLLTTFELGDIFLSSLEFQAPALRALSYPEFLQALVRCALVAYSKISESTILDKLRGLFLYMWRAIRNAPKAWSDGRRSGSTYTGDLIQGVQIFNRKFIAAWALDGNRDYLSPPPAIRESGQTSLDRIFASDQSARALSGSARGPPVQFQQQQPFFYGSTSPSSSAAGSLGSSTLSGGGGGGGGSGAGYGAWQQQQQPQQQQPQPQQQQQWAPQQQQQQQQQQWPPQQQQQQQWLPQQQQYAQPQQQGGGGGGGAWGQQQQQQPWSGYAPQ